MGNISLCAKFQVCSFLCSDAIVFTTDRRTDGRTDRHSSNVLEFCADQMSPRNMGPRSLFLGVTNVLTKVIYPLWGGYKNAYIYLYPFSSFSVQKFCGRTDGRTDGRTLAKKFCFCCLIKNIYTCPILNISHTFLFERCILGIETAKIWTRTHDGLRS